MTASLDGSGIRISGRTSHGDFEIEGTLRAVRHGSFGNWLQRSWPFLWQPDPYRTPNGLGRLQGGGTRSGGYFWYLFAAFPSSGATRLLELPADVIGGVIRLPPITVNGKRYPPQTIPFEKQTAFGMMPVNC